MRKNVIILLTVFFLFRLFWSIDICYAVTVADLYPAAKTFDAATKVYRVPAAIRTASAIATSESTVVLSMDIAKAANLGALVAGAAIVYGGSQFFDYFNNSINIPNTPYTTSGNQLMYTTVSPVWPPCINKPNQSYIYIGSVASGGYTFVTNAGPTYMAQQSCSASEGTGTVSCGTCGGTCYSKHLYGCSGPLQVGTSIYIYGIQIATPPAGSQSSNTVPASTAQISASLTTGLTAGNAAAIYTAGQAIDIAGQVYPSGFPKDGSNPYAITGALGLLLKTIFDSAISSTDVDALNLENSTKTAEENATEAAEIAKAGLTAAELAAVLTSQGLTATDIADAIAANNPSLTADDIADAIAAANPALTQQEVADAVADGIGAEFGNDVDPPLDPTILTPTKLSLTTVMGSFMSTINDLPMMQTLQGLTINCSGTSSLCLNLPANLGGNRCYDASGMQGALNMVGSAFLGLTTIFSFVGIFRS